MGKGFKGTVNLGIRDSVADWTPYEQPRPPEGAPNVLFIMWDDTGFASWESYGGLVKMPNMDRLSKTGDAVHPVPHHGAVLTHESIDADGAQPYVGEHGRHLRDRLRLPGLQRGHPVQRGDHRGGAPGEGLEHLCARQVAPDAARRAEHGGIEAHLADLIAGSTATTASWVPRPTSGIRIWCRTTRPSTSPTRWKTGTT